MRIQVVLVAAIVQISGILGDLDDYKNNINFLVTKRATTSPPTDSTFTSKFDNGAALQAFCPVSNPITILVHGYSEKTTISYRAPLTKNFLDARGGCVIWMDYGVYSGTDGDPFGYLGIVAFDYSSIVKVLEDKLVQLSTLGYDMANVHMFGFSLGSHVMLRGAYQYKNNNPNATKVGRADACEPAGPLFSASSLSVEYAGAAAKKVQVIHTSYNNIGLLSLGTKLRYGQKDISMGNCGKTQAAGGSADRINHYLCTTFYINSFTNDFPLIKKPSGSACKASTLGLTDGPVPSPTVTMGYRLDFSIPNGMYYAKTTATAPYNK